MTELATVPQAPAAAPDRDEAPRPRGGAPHQEARRQAGGHRRRRPGGGGARAGGRRARRRARPGLRCTCCAARASRRRCSRTPRRSSRSEAEEIATLHGDRDAGRRSSATARPAQLAKAILREEKRMAGFLEKLIPRLTRSVAQGRDPGAAAQRRPAEHEPRRTTSSSCTVDAAAAARAPRAAAAAPHAAPRTRSGPPARPSRSRSGSSRRAAARPRSGGSTSSAHQQAHQRARRTAPERRAAPSSTARVDRRCPAGRRRPGVRPLASAALVGPVAQAAEAGLREVVEARRRRTRSSRCGPRGDVRGAGRRSRARSTPRRSGCT